MKIALAHSSAQLLLVAAGCRLRIMNFNSSEGFALALWTVHLSAIVPWRYFVFSLVCRTLSACNVFRLRTQGGASCARWPWAELRCTFGAKTAMTICDTP